MTSPRFNRFAALDEVVNHYNALMKLNLTESEKPTSLST